MAYYDAEQYYILFRSHLFFACLELEISLQQDGGKPPGSFVVQILYHHCNAIVNETAVFPAFAGVGKTFTHTLLARALYNSQPDRAHECPGVHCIGRKVRLHV